MVECMEPLASRFQSRRIQVCGVPDDTVDLCRHRPVDLPDISTPYRAVRVKYRLACRLRPFDKLP
jgi:hypothetical protein